MHISDVERVTKVSTDVSRACEHCDFGISYEDIEGAINHYISDHGYKLLYVGAETGGDGDGNPCHHTVAILGAEKPPPVLNRTVDFVVNFASVEDNQSNG